MRGGGGETRSCNLGDDKGWEFGGEISDGKSGREKGESWRAVREVLELGGARITRTILCKMGESDREDRRWRRGNGDVETGGEEAERRAVTDVW